MTSLTLDFLQIVGQGYHSRIRAGATRNTITWTTKWSLPAKGKQTSLHSMSIFSLELMGTYLGHMQHLMAKLGITLNTLAHQSCLFDKGIVCKSSHLPQPCKLQSTRQHWLPLIQFHTPYSKRSIILWRIATPLWCNRYPWNVTLQPPVTPCTCNHLLKIERKYIPIKLEKKIWSWLLFPERGNKKTWGVKKTKKTWNIAPLWTSSWATGWWMNSKSDMTIDAASYDVFAEGAIWTTCPSSLASRCHPTHQ